MAALECPLHPGPCPVDAGQLAQSSSSSLRLDRSARAVPRKPRRWRVGCLPTSTAREGGAARRPAHQRPPEQ